MKTQRWILGTVLFSAALSLSIDRASAHDTDCNGKAQPAVVMSGCCGKEDYRALKPDEVRADGQGWDVFLDGKWREARHSDKMWLIAQPTLSACWGVWYRRGHMEGTQEYYTSHEGDTDDYAFYCLEQPATN